jgi:hypothetical protein
MKVVEKKTSTGEDARRKRERQKHKWNIEEGILLEVEWMKELMCLFSLNKGVSESRPL